MNVAKESMAITKHITVKILIFLNSFLAFSQLLKALPPAANVMKKLATKLDWLKGKIWGIVKEIITAASKIKTITLFLKKEGVR